jgi:hypothetical protein
MGHKDDKLFTLDRDGGREKISRATYAPRSHRRANTTSRARSKWSLSIAVLVGAIIGTVLFRFI